MPTVVVSRPLHGPFDVPGAQVRTGPVGGQRTRAELLAFIAGADAIVSWITERVDDEFLDAAGPQLRVVSNYAVGYDNIDLDACARRSVVVTNTPDAVTEGTADVAVMHLLAAARRLSEADRFVRSGEWAKQGILGPSDWLGQPIAGRTLLIVGAGLAGLLVAGCSDDEPSGPGTVTVTGGLWHWMGGVGHRGPGRARWRRPGSIARHRSAPRSERRNARCAPRSLSVRAAAPSCTGPFVSRLEEPLSALCHAPQRRAGRVPLAPLRRGLV